jgi:hypothetical protein
MLRLCALGSAAGLEGESWTTCFHPLRGAETGTQG